MRLGITGNPFHALRNVALPSACRYGWFCAGEYSPNAAHRTVRARSHRKLRWLARVNGGASGSLSSPTGACRVGAGLR